MSAFMLTKKPAKKSFRVLAGIYVKPKKLFATYYVQNCKLICP